MTIFYAKPSTGRGGRVLPTIVLLISFAVACAQARWFGRKNKDAHPEADWGMTPAQVERFETMGIEPARIVGEGAAPLSDEDARRVGAHSHYMLGVLLTARGDYQGAEEAYSQALEADPDSELIRVALAESHLYQGDITQCIEMCKRMRAEGADSVEIHLLLGRAYEKIGQDEKAIEAYREGLEKLPESLSLLEPLGDLYLRMRDTPNIIDTYERIHQRLRKGQRRSPLVMIILAHFYESGGQLDKAIEMYEEAIRVYPNNPRFFVNLAELLRKAGRPAEALEVCKKGLIRDPTDENLLRLFEECAGSREDILREYRAFADEYDQLVEIQMMWGRRSMERLRDLDSAIEAFHRVLEFDEHHRGALLGLGEALLMSKQVDEAIKYFHRVVDQYSDELRAYRGLAAAYAQELRWIEAARQYEHLLEFAPGDMDAYLKLSHFYEQAGEPERAVEAVRRGIEQSSDERRTSVLRERLGRIQYTRKRYEEAAKAFSQAIEERPNDLALYQQLMLAHLGRNDDAAMDELVARGREVFDNNAFEFQVLVSRVYWDYNRYDKSIAHLRRAIEINPEPFFVHNDLVNRLIEVERYEAAKAALEGAEERFGVDERPRLALDWAKLYSSQQKYAEAVAVLEPRIEELRKVEGVNSATLLRYYALCLEGAGRHDDAVAACGEIVKEAEGPLEEVILRLAGYLYADLAAWEKSREVFERLAEKSPKEAEYQYQLGVAYNMLERNEKAEKHLKRAIELNPRHSNALNHLGYLYAEENRNLDKAIELIERALDIHPDAGHIIDSLGWAYYKKGEIDKAIEYLEKALTYQTDPEILEHLGDAQHAKGDIEQAVETWKRALEQDETRTSLQKKIERGREEIAREQQDVPDGAPSPTPQP